jgi:hypothetical protein
VLHGELLPVVCLSFGRRDIANRFEQSVVIAAPRPRKLVTVLADVFPDLAHVHQVGLGTVADREVWD